MGVRLVRYNNGVVTGSGSSSGTYDHNELTNRDLVNQHPISAITGLQESLDELQALINSLVNRNANSNILNIQQEFHELSVGDVVYLKSDGKYAKAFGEDSERIEVVGIITKIIDENNFVITVSGEFQTTDYDSYPNGTVLYLSDTDIGVLTDKPIQYIKPIAIKINTGILINIQRANEYSFGGTLLYYTSEEIINAINSLW